MTTPHAAIVLAAGLGMRMRPLTRDLPKPLLPLAGRSLLDHAIDRLGDVGVSKVVVNAHHQAERLTSHLAGRRSPPDIKIMMEDTLLDTGGSVAAALPELGPDPFYVINGDAFWLDGPRPALDRLAKQWRPDLLALLLVHRAAMVHAQIGSGDFTLDPLGVPRRPRERELVPYVFTGVQIVSPALLVDAPAAPFSLNSCWDRALEQGRMRAVVHDGLWFHLSTPADLADAEALLHEGAVGQTR